MPQIEPIYWLVMFLLAQGWVTALVSSFHFFLVLPPFEGGGKAGSRSKVNWSWV
nr:ATP synthase F0 subunit 8 [Degeeriella rufa]